MFTIETIRDQIRQVGEWSHRNFGFQESKSIPGLRLDGVAPFLGIVEEYGELLIAIEKKDKDDAYADMAVFLFDFLYREGIVDDFILPEKIRPGSRADGMAIAFGALAHCILKYHQGIREFKDKKVYRRHVIQNAGMLYLHIASTPEFDEIFLTTWAKVSKRDWKKNPTNAHKIAGD